MLIFRFILIPLISCIVTSFAYAKAVALSGGLDSIGLPQLESTNSDLPVASESGKADTALSIVGSFGGQKQQCANKLIADITMGKTQKVSPTSIWSSNSGINSYNQVTLAKSPCRAMLTERFYRELSAGETIVKKGDDRLKNGGRPALNAKVGEGTFAHQSPGFALKSAMDLSNGNKVLAMSIIGYCGHDDQHNESDLVIGFSDKNSRNSVLNYINSQVNAYGKPIEPYVKADLDKIIKTVSASQNLRMGINCPPYSSAFYAPQALHKQVDISESLKNEIASIQAPNKGAKALPAKAYHTMFGAVLGCRLSATCGLTADEAAAKLQLVAANYRNLRLKGQSLRYYELKKIIEKEFKVNWGDEKALEAKSSEIHKWISSAHAKRIFEKADLSELLSDARKKMPWSSWKTSVDAAILNVEALPSCPKQWTSTRCQEALNKKKTHNIDAEWTKAQQKAGGNFGAEYCANQTVKSEESLEVEACKALDKLSESTPKDPQQDPSLQSPEKSVY